MEVLEAVEAFTNPIVPHQSNSKDVLQFSNYFMLD